MANFDFWKRVKQLVLAGIVIGLLGMTSAAIKLEKYNMINQDTVQLGNRYYKFNEHMAPPPHDCRKFYISRIPYCTKDINGIWHCFPAHQKICDKY